MATFSQIQTRDVSGQAPDRSVSGLPRLWVALAGALLIWSLPYWVPGLERWRPINLGEVRSVWGYFHTDPAELTAAETGVATSYQALPEFPGSAPVERPERVGDQGGNQGPKARADGAEARRQGAFRAAARSGSALKITIPEEDYAGVKVQIEDPRGVMAGFYEALARTARQEEGAVTRISHWGDSAIATDKITAVARLLFQQRFGDSGHGFILRTRAVAYRGRNFDRIAAECRVPIASTQAVAAPGSITFKTPAPAAAGTSFRNRATSSAA